MCVCNKMYFTTFTFNLFNVSLLNKVLIKKKSDLTLMLSLTAFQQNKEADKYTFTIILVKSIFKCDVGWRE